MHPSILDVYHYFEDTKRFMLVTELCSKGELFQYIQDQNGKIELDQCAMILKQVISAVDYVHTLDIVHRDLKPENILIDSISKDYIQIKLIDFGTCIDLHDENKGKSDKCGTLTYMSPEIMDKGKLIDYSKLGKAGDMWAIGVIAYILVVQEMPFNLAKSDKDAMRSFL